MGILFLYKGIAIGFLLPTLMHIIKHNFFKIISYHI